MFFAQWKKKKLYVFIFEIMFDTSDYASPGFATYMAPGPGLICIFCQFGDFGDFLATFWLILILGQFVITPCSDIF